MKTHELELIGLDGTDGSEITAGWITKSGELGHLFEKYRAVTCAGDNGALNVWLSDDGMIQAVHYRYCITQDRQTFNSIKDAKKWLTKTLLLINL